MKTLGKLGILIIVSQEFPRLILKSTLFKIYLGSCLFWVCSPVLAENAEPTVVSIGDGDTLRISQAGQITTIRLGCIDAPERAQSPWGRQSTSRLKQLLPPGKAVQVREITRDRYGRTVAELYLGKQSVNLEMVKEGQAVVYRQYLDECAVTKDQYLQAEAQAKQKRLGFWNQKSPIMPWDYRRLGKAHAARTQRGKPQSLISISKPPKTPPQNRQLPSCVNSDCNCSDFSTQAQAQQVLNAFPGDKFRLDRDFDGIACESLP